MLKAEADLRALKEVKVKQEPISPRNRKAGAQKPESESVSGANEAPVNTNPITGTSSSSSNLNHSASMGHQVFVK